MRDMIGQRHLMAIVCFASMLSCLACSPSLPPSLKLPRLDPTLKQESSLKNAPMRPYVFVDHFIDARLNKTLVQADGQDVRAEGDIVQTVVKAFRRALEKYGFQFADTAPILLSGEIRQWRASIEGGFQKRVRADAAVFVEVLDPANKRIYSGVYQGYALVQAPGIGADDVQGVLKTAMEEAISQVIADQQMMRLLASF